MKPPESEVKPPDAEVKPPDAEVKPPDAEVKPPDAEVKPPESVTRPPQSWLWGHFDRLGGMLISPRATIRRLIDGQDGRVGEILIWLVILTAAASPVRTGRAMLIGRIGILDGVVAFLAQLQPRLLGLFVAAIVVAAVLAAVGRRRGLGFDRALDVTGHLLVPVLLLIAAGVLLKAAGVNIWFLPHRPLRGGPQAQAIYLTATYGWSVVLLGFTLWELYFGGTARDPTAEQDSALASDDENAGGATA